MMGLGCAWTHQLTIAAEKLGTLNVEDAQVKFETANLGIRGGSYLGGTDALNLGHCANHRDAACVVPKYWLAHHQSGDLVCHLCHSILL